jgi:hypothetical protein
MGKDLDDISNTSMLNILDVCGPLDLDYRIDLLLIYVS